MNNEPPVVLSDVDNLYITIEDGKVIFEVKFLDPEGDDVEVKIESDYFQLIQAFNKETGIFSWDVNFPVGFYTVTFSASNRKESVSIEAEIFYKKI